MCVPWGNPNKDHDHIKIPAQTEGTACRLNAMQGPRMWVIRMFCLSYGITLHTWQTKHTGVAIRVNPKTHRRALTQQNLEGLENTTHERMHEWEGGEGEGESWQSHTSCLCKCHAVADAAYRSNLSVSVCTPQSDHPMSCCQNSFYLLDMDFLLWTDPDLTCFWNPKLTDRSWCQTPSGRTLRGNIAYSPALD